MIEKFLNKNLLKFENYLAKMPKEKIVLGSNENPYNLIEDEEFNKGYMEVLNQLKVNRYPDPNADEIRGELAAYTNTNAENIIVGNGADEVIDMILATFINPEDVVITHSPSFEMYTISAKSKGARCISVPDLDHRIDTDGIIENANFLKAKLIFLCVPNNPTGYCVPKREVQRIIDETKSLVVLDMAYIEFSEEDYGDLKLNDRVIRLRTLSKAFGLASLRVGYGIASTEIIKAINLIKPPYNLNQLSQNLATYTLKNRVRLESIMKIIKEEKGKLYDEIDKLENVETFPTGSNFFLVKVNKDKIELFNRLLKEEDIRVRMYPSDSNLAGYYRITVGRPEENEVLIGVLRSIG